MPHSEAPMTYGGLLAVGGENTVEKMVGLRSWAFSTALLVQAS